MYGKVYLIGAGPGDPGLITVKGMELLKICDVVIHDRLASPRLLGVVKRECEIIYAGKAVGRHTMKQEEINRLICDKALEGKLVVRLKGGDPYVFGRGGEEALCLTESGIYYEVIPGVTSAVAAAQAAGIPVTHRGISQSFHVLTGHTAQEEEELYKRLGQLAEIDCTLVILMGLMHLDRIQSILIEFGKKGDTPAAVISNATTPCQRDVRGTLSDISERVREAKLESPAVLVIGTVAAMDLRAVKRGCLSGKRIGISGTDDFTARLQSDLEREGAEVSILYRSQIILTQELSQLKRACDELTKYHWIAFTSSNAVTIFFDHLNKWELDHRRLAHLRFAAIGRSTAERLRRYGIHADYIPEQYDAASLARGIGSILKAGERLLLPRARQGAEDLPSILAECGISFDDIKFYDTLPEEHVLKAYHGAFMRFDYLVFGSSSGVQGLMTGLEEVDIAIIREQKAVCIGQATEKALREYGFTNRLLSEEASIEGLVNRICADVRDAGE